MTEVESRPEDVGQILVKVQEDLRQLREKLRVQGADQRICIDDIQNALARTEEGLQSRADEVINHMNNQVSTLNTANHVVKSDHYMMPDSAGDVRTQQRMDVAIRRMDCLNTREVINTLSHTGSLLPLRKPMQMKGLTPGQEMKQKMGVKAIVNPHNSQNRYVLEDSYGITLPLIPERKQSKNQGKIVMGATVEPLAVLPKANRVDAQLAPPPITEDDARRGILSLLQRGLIPSAAQITLDPSPVRNKLVPLHSPQEKTKPTPITETTQNLANVKLETSTRHAVSMDSLNKIPAVPAKPSSDKRSISAKTRGSSAQGRIAKTPASMKTFEMQLQPHPPPTTPASLEYKQFTHRFAIQHGRVRDNSNEFLGYKQHYCLTWGSIVTMLKHLEKMLTNYSVPLAFINGDRLAELSMEFELEKVPSVHDLLSVIINKEDVQGIIFKPGRRFLGPKGKEMAATNIQSSWRRFKDRSKYLDYRRHKWAAGVIAISWIMHIKMVQVRRQLKQTRLDQLEAFRRRAQKFAASWDRIKNSKRVIIHLPSLGLTQNIRDTFHDFGVRQNTQMARLCDIRDPNVDVVFVSPVSLSEETLQYYSKLLGLKAAVESGIVDDQCDMGERYKIIVPEAIKSFPTHRMCLSTILHYSPRALQRIKNLVQGRDAFIITGMPHTDDLAVSDALDLPVLSPEPDIAHLYSTKSGCKRVFASAGVPVPPSEYDVYSLGQLHECLAQLVTENLLVKRWLFKLDDEFDGRGIAYCDISEHLQCYKWALKESIRYGEKWNKKWAQENAFVKIHAEIPDILSNFAVPVNKKIYKTWSTFLEAFLGQGGVIEACPPSDSITVMTADVFIEPTGQQTVVCVGDQIHAESPFSCWGVSVPQSSVEPEEINAACHKVMNACKTRGIMGYFSIDFVTFIDPKTMEQKVWALDLSLQYSDSLAMFQLLCYISKGEFNSKNHVFNVQRPPQEKKTRRRRLQGQDEEHPPNTTRYGVMSSRLLHTNLAVVHYSVFFQMCRAHGIGFDIKEKQGTVFTLIDSFNREKLGMLTIGDNLQGVLATFARNLSVIHQEISAPNMQGETNFKCAIEDLEGILGTTVQNVADNTPKQHQE